MAGGELSTWRVKADDNLALWCLLTQQHEDGARSEEAKPSMRRQLWWRLAWRLVDSIAWQGAARCFDKQGKAEQSDKMGMEKRGRNEEGKTKPASSSRV
jgi:hypothetical protein